MMCEVRDVPVIVHQRFDNMHFGSAGYPFSKTKGLEEGELKENLFSRSNEKTLHFGSSKTEQHSHSKLSVSVINPQPN